MRMWIHGFWAQKSSHEAKLSVMCVCTHMHVKYAVCSALNSLCIHAVCTYMCSIYMQVIGRKLVVYAMGSIAQTPFQGHWIYSLSYRVFWLLTVHSWVPFQADRSFLPRVLLPSRGQPSFNYGSFRDTKAQLCVGNHCKEPWQMAEVSVAVTLKLEFFLCSVLPPSPLRKVIPKITTQ